MEEIIRLSDWAAKNDLTYLNAHRKFSKKQIDGAFRDTDGHIKVKITKEINTQANAAITHSCQIPEIKYENISLAEDIQTRKNKAATSEIVSRFSNIDQGIVPFYDSSFQGNKSGITIRDCLVLINKAYHNFSVVKNIIELLTEFSSGEILFRGGNKKSRDFFKAYFRKINLTSFISCWFREYYRSGNVFVYVFKKEINQKDVNKIATIYGEKSAEITDGIKLPTNFTILNPIDISVGSSVTFLRPIYYKILNSYELKRLRKPLTDTDQEVFDSLPDDAKAQIRNKKIQSVQLPLSTDDVVAVFNAKQPYEALALPPFFSVLDDLDFKASMRKMDIATMKLINQAILLVTTGTEPDKGGINPANITNLQNIFLNESVGRVLIADYTTKATFIVPPIAEILDPKKYEAINNDIYIGLNYILLGDEKFANQASKIQIFIERIKHARQIFLDEFLFPVIKEISKNLKFKNYPEPYFADIDLKNDVEWARIYTRLSEIGFLTPEEAFTALDNGKLPLIDESEENQNNFKKLKDKGLYQPIAGGPADQMNALKVQNQHDIKMQETNNMHDDKQRSKDRKHAAENPQAPSPQIVLNAPTKLAQPNGRPAGSKRPQSTKNPRVLGEETLFSGSKVIENVLKADALNKKVISSIMSKFNLKRLNETQLTLAEELANIIVRNENPEKWDESISEYINAPKDKNLERIEEIKEIAETHGLDINLAAILYTSQKE